MAKKKPKNESPTATSSTPMPPLSDRLAPPEGAPASQPAPPAMMMEEINNPPVISPPGSKTCHPEIPLSFQVDAFDPDGEDLTFSLIDPPTGASIDSSSGMFNWTPTWSQVSSYLVTIKVTDTHGASDQTGCQITVENAPPQIYNPGEQYGHPGHVMTFQVSASDPDNDPLTFTLVDGPSGANIDPSMGTFTWTPSSGQLGDTFLSIRATDPGGAYAQVEVLAHVENAAPVIAPCTAQVAHPGHLLEFSVSAHDPNQDPLTYSLIDPPEGVTIDATSGLVSWTPTWSQLGLHMLTIRASDPYGAYSETNCSVNVANEPPQISPPSSQFVYVDEPVAFTVTAMDPDNDPLTYELLSPPAGATIEATSGSFSWTPSTSQLGQHFITIRVMDPGGAEATCAVLITVEQPPGP